MRVARVANLARALLASAKRREFGALAHEARRRVRSDWLHYGLRRHLDEPFEAASAEIPLTIRPLRESDLPILLGDAEDMSARGPYIRMHRRNFLQAGIGQCFVAVTEQDEPCYMQWLMPGAESARIERYFGGIFPRLAADEALLEYAFTRESYQGKGIMAAAMARIAEKAADHGGRHVITFVDHENVPALKGCRRAGFSPYLVRYDRWRFFRRIVSFRPVKAGESFPWDAKER